MPKKCPTLYDQRICTNEGLKLFKGDFSFDQKLHSEDLHLFNLISGSLASNVSVSASRNAELCQGPVFYPVLMGCPSAHS